MSFALLARSLVETKSQVEDGFTADKGFFMVILDVNVEDVHGTVELSTFVVQVFQHSIEAALLTGNDNIDNTSLGPLRAFVLDVFETGLAGHPVLEALGKAFDVKISPKHVQQPVVGVEGGVLLCELIVDGAISGAVEVIDIGLHGCWARQAHKRASTKADGGQVRRGKLQVSFHGAEKLSLKVDYYQETTYRFWLLAHTVQNLSLN